LLTMIAFHSTPQLMQLLQTPHTKSARTVQFRTCLVAQSWRLCQLCNRSSCQPQSCYFQKVRQHTPPIVHHGPGAATTTNMCAKHWLMRIVESFRQILGTVLCRTPLLGQSWSYHNSIPFHLIEQMQLLSVPVTELHRRIYMSSVKLVLRHNSFLEFHLPRSSRVPTHGQPPKNGLIALLSATNDDM